MTHARDRMQPAVAHRRDDDNDGRAPATSTPSRPAWASAVEAVVRAAGHPLDPGTRRAAERHFGLDLSHVRIHRDPAAAASARAIAARAYSLGPHIVFAPGRYAPSTLFHELAHVVQRGPGAPLPTGPLVLGPRDAPHERAARDAARNVPSDSLGATSTHVPPGILCPALPAHVVARDAEEDEAMDRAFVAALGLPVPGPGETQARVKHNAFDAPHTRGNSGLLAVERTAKATVYPGSDRSAAPELGRDGTITAPRTTTGYVRSVELTQSQALTPTGAQANTKHIESDKTFHGVTLAGKGGQTLLDGSAVEEVDAELALGRSEKTSRQRIHNSAATTQTSTFKTFHGSKLTLNGVDANKDFRETEIVDGEESRRTIHETRSRDKKGREVAVERGYRAVTTDGRSGVRLRNTGTKYQALDLTRSEILTGRAGHGSARRTEVAEREIDHADGQRQREASATHQRGRMTTVEGSRRLAGGGELKHNLQASSGRTTTTKTSELSDGSAFQGKQSWDTAIGRRSNRTITVNKPGATPIAPRVLAGAPIAAGSLGLITPTAPDPRTVRAGDVDRAGGYTESLNIQDGLLGVGQARTQTKDEYEVTDRGVSAGVSTQVETGTLRSFLRKDRLNLGWLVIENAITDYYHHGAKGKLAAGAKLGRDTNNLNAGASGSYGATRSLSDELTVRVGNFFAKIKAEADSFAGIEAALSVEAGHTRGAGLGSGANASAFAGVRAGLGGKLEGGYDSVSFAAGAYKLRGSLGAGFKANIEARYQNGYLLLAGGLGLSAELGVGADIELRINPAAVGAAIAKRVAGTAVVTDTARKAYSRVRGWFGR